MGQELVIPGTFKGPAKAFQQLAGKGDSLAVGIGQSYGVLNYKGKVWSLRYRGEKKTFVRPDDGTPANYLDVIILGQAKTKSKSFFAKYDPNSGDSGDRPICSSIDGILPDDDVTQKQAESCSLCPRNVWKTDPATGRRGRECTDYKRLAVLVLPPQTRAILGQPLMEAVFLRVPPASLNSLAIMGDTMEKQGYHFSSYITRITFDPQKSWPEMVFKPVQELTDAEAPVIFELMGDDLVKRITEGDISRRNNGEDGVGIQVIPPGQSALQNAPQTLQAAQPQPGAPLSPLQNASAGATSPPAAAPPPQPGSSIIVPQAPVQATALHTEASAPPAITNGAQMNGGAFGGLSAPPSASPADGQRLQAQPSVADTGTVADTGILSGGANGVIPSDHKAAPSAPPAVAVASNSDAGVAEESDADLDARIASILAKKA